MSTLKEYLKDERGATAVEYGLIAALISAAIIGGLSSYTNSVLNMFTVIESKVQ